MTFETCFDRLLGNEGGYSNDPADPGGETNWGVSKRAYPDVDIKNLTRDGAKELYMRDFWMALRMANFHEAIQFQLFDFAVNSSIQTAIRYMQRAVGVADDGHWGPASQAAADRQSDTDTLFLLNAERLDFMTRCKNWSDAGRGWARRIATNLRYCAKDA